ncbi:hypothetical protein SDC9_201512 [bioreactor metagenome]|uniref:Uncharacterized protein n=1 Tax=bioreactor metagenome TaxID=1076179 RepID=A0A645J024_9ZZZZ
MFKRTGIAAVFCTTREFHQGGEVLGQPGHVSELLLVIQADALNEQVPEVVAQKIPLGIRVQARIAHLLQQGIFFKPGP